MSGTFDEKGTGSDFPGKRPAPTIEGTATEVEVQPVADADKDAGETERTDESATPVLEAAPSGTDDGDPEKTPSEEPGEDDEDSDDNESGSDDTDHEADDAPAASAAQPQPQPQGRSFGARLLAWIAALFTHALAGLAGGLAVLAALSWGYLPVSLPQDTAGADAIASRIAALESAPQTPDNTAALEALKSRLATLESKTAEPAQPAVDPAEIEALSEQVAQMEASLKSMAEAAKDGGSVSDAAAISRQVAEAEQRLDSQIQSKVQSEVESALASGAAPSADAKSVEALKTEVADLDAKLKALTEAALSADEGSNLKPEISALERRLSAIETMLPSLAEEIDAENAQTKRANLAIAFSGLRDAVVAGRPYATELTTMTALSPDSEELADLIEYEDTGIPTVSMLTEQFGPLRDKALAALSESEQGLLGRLLGSAQSLVKVRRIGEDAEGDGPDAILARADAQLEAGKLQEAVMELEDLDGPPAALFAPWIDGALARLDAESALQRLQDALLVSLVGGAGDPKPGPRTPDAETE